MPGRDERWGVWGAISGPPIFFSGHSALLVLLLGGALDAAFLDLAAPGARLAAPALHEFLEALQVALDAHLHDAEGVAQVLDHAVRVVVELKHHLGAVVV